MQSILITGAGGGIGSACAMAFSEKGYRVLLLGRNRAKLEATATRIAGPSQCLALDLNDPHFESHLKQQLEAADLSRHPLRAVINNAGIVKREAFTSASDQSWQEQFAVNLFGPARLLRVTYPFLKSCPGSSVVNVSSNLATRPLAHTSVYSASKAALNQLTQVLALEWAKDGIRVNSLSPGLVDTPIHSFHGEDESSPERTAAHQAQPLGRMGRPEEIAAAVCFLALDTSSWTTGSDLRVDGGISLL